MTQVWAASSLGVGRGRQRPSLQVPPRSPSADAQLLRPRGHTWENWAKVRSASMGTCPSSSWQQSLCWGRTAGGAGGRGRSLPPPPAARPPRRAGLGTHGSGECMGEEAWRMYWVHWKTRKARLARKSRADSRPATGRSWKPVRSARAAGVGGGQRGWGRRLATPGPPAGASTAAHPSGSGRRPPAGGCYPPGTRRSAPAARKPPGVPGTRGWRRGPAAWCRPPSCGRGREGSGWPGAPHSQPGPPPPAPDPSPHPAAPPVGALLCPLQTPGSLTL